MIASLIIKPVYQADAKIMVKIGRENIYNPEGSGASPLFTPNKEEQINSEIEILKSQSLLDSVIMSLGVPTIYNDLNITDASLWHTFFPDTLNTGTAKSFSRAQLRLQNNIHVERVPKSDVIHVSFKHTNSQIAADVVNTWIDLFFDAHLNIHENSQSYEFYRKQSVLLRDRLERGEAKQTFFMNQHDITDPEEERRLLMKQSANLKIDLNKTLSREAEIESRIDETHNQLDKAQASLALNEKINHSPKRINTLRTQLTQLKQQEKKLLEVSNEQSFLVLDVRDRIRIIHSKLKEQDNLRHAIPYPGVVVVYQKLFEKLSHNEIEIKALKASKETILLKLTNYQAKIKRISKIETEFNNLKQKVAIDRKNYHRYLSKLEGSRMTSAMNKERISNVRLINPAQPPLVPISPKILLNIILSILIGALGGLGLAFFLEYLDDSMESEEDVENLLNLPLLASIPVHKKGIDSTFLTS
jgi:uncharacterized protein involved in exopolysaccharide biosynthesis